MNYAIFDCRILHNKFPQEKSYNTSGSLGNRKSIFVPRASPRAKAGWDRQEALGTRRAGGTVVPVLLRIAHFEDQCLDQLN